MNSCLNLTNPQFIVSTVPTPPTRVIPVHLANAYGNRSGTTTPLNGRGRGQGTPRIMANPARGRGGSPGVNGRSGSPAHSQPQPAMVNLFNSARGGHGFRGHGPAMFAGGRGGVRGIQRPIAVLQNGRGSAQAAQQPTPVVQNDNAPLPRGRGTAQRGRGNAPARGRGDRGGRRGNTPAHRRVSSSGATVPS
jgi:hypothetical protein